MLTEPEMRVLVGVEMALRHGKDTGELVEDRYYSGIVKLAREYATRGALSEAIARVRWCPEAFLKGSMAGEMRRDPVLLDAAYGLSRALVDAGVVSIEPVFRLTGPGGQA